MARPSDEFLLAWSSLSCEDHAAGWQAISLPSAGPVEVQVGRYSPSNMEAILFCFPTARLTRSEKLPEGKGFLIEQADSTGQVGIRLALTRQEAGSTDLFAAMACDIVDAIDNAAASGEPEPRLLNTLIGRVIAWQQFMSRGAAPLGPEAELGLAGELNFITILLSSGVSPEAILKSWVGPDDAPQDFLLGDGAVEIKATMSSSGFSVKIGSLEQLDDSVASPLFLAAIRFSGGDGGLTLPEIITQVENGLMDKPGLFNQFGDKLLMAGYIDDHANQYTRKFEQKELRIFSVSTNFPRLTPGSVPVGITRTVYEINLEQTGKFLIDLETVLKKLGASI